MAVICQESDDEEEDEAKRHSEKAIEDARVVLALIELSIRNVPLTLEFLRRALPLYEGLRGRTKYYFTQSLSPRWSPEFVQLLRQTRLFRAAFVMPGARAEAQRPDRANCCVACGQCENASDEVLELAGDYPPQQPIESHTAHGLALAYDQRDDSDAALVAALAASPELPPQYYGMLSCGKTCTAKVLTALFAKNFISVLFDETREQIDDILQDPAERAAWETHEHNRAEVFALFDTRERAIALLARLEALEDRLLGRPGAIAIPSPVGSARVWKPLAKTLATAPLRACARRVHVLLGIAPPQPPKRRAPPPIAKRCLRSHTKAARPVSARTRSAS